MDKANRNKIKAIDMQGIFNVFIFSFRNLHDIEKLHHFKLGFKNKNDFKKT